MVGGFAHAGRDRGHEYEDKLEVTLHMDSERLLSISRLKEHTGLSESGIRRLVRQGVIPAVRIGRRILFKPSSIARFLDQRETGGDIRPKRGRKGRRVA
jgi:excisionase family DNA binding protein